ncbi:uncharacterized protein GBIM_12474 [Gryllus bimaculatus]|nr:uncharacterized protein GBIM_12474 [Gryllus bimaculatus]
MFSRICRLLTRNIRSDVGMYPSFQVARLMHHVQNDSKTTAMNGGELQSFLKSNSTCGLIALKHLPQTAPIGRVNSRILDFPFPFSYIPVPVDKRDPFLDVQINEPHQDKVVEKQAARLIVIRRRKMKKHKLRKLRKKMKFEWAKVRQRRELRKEKLFQAKLVAQMKEADEFDAAEYVSEKLRKIEEFSQLEEKKRKFEKKL